MNNISFITNLLKKISEPDEPAVVAPAGLPGIAPPPIIGANAEGLVGGGAEYLPPIEPPVDVAPAAPALTSVGAGAAPAYDTAPVITPPPGLPSTGGSAAGYFNELYPTAAPPAIAPGGTPGGVPQATEGFMEKTPEERLREIDNEANYNKPIYKRKGSDETTSSEEKAQKWAEGYDQVQAAGSRRNKKWSLLEKIGAAAAGWATGGLAGGIQAGMNRNYFPQMKDQMERARLLPQIGARAKIEKTQAETRRANAQAAGVITESRRKANKDVVDLAATEARLKQEQQKIHNVRDKFVTEIDDDGKMWKIYNVSDPNRTGGDRQPVLENGKQVQFDSMRKQEYELPNGQKVRLNAKDIAQLSTKEAEFIAEQKQKAETATAQGQFQAAKANAANRLKYSQALTEQFLKTATTDAEAKGASADALRLSKELEADAARLDAIDADGEPKRYNEAKKAFDAKLEKTYQLITKTKVGQAAVEQLRANQMERPETVTFRAITPSTGRTARPVAAGKDRLKLFSK